MTIWCLLFLASLASAISTGDLRVLNSSVSGRLFQATPFSRPCFQSGSPNVGQSNAAQCSLIIEKYRDRGQSSHIYLGPPIVLLISKQISDLNLSDLTWMWVPVFYHILVGRFLIDSKTEWETCQATSAQCLLDAAQPNNTEAFSNRTCDQGSVPAYFVSVEGEKPEFPSID